ncbi:bifunctional Rab-GTPase-TBC domain superfamily/Rab-GTPase-TBC domain [Babesia duncani]|uniref:Bifunctional Rab-GTPase-TBC domain superfamily/Rab-GTPase-TBC domain n=1 Tax=Babesia duncani TaxID=323732 RepID=A0AAD9UQM6_9APIC|nr:bifunctional Rab-GTPase-TBC domain superfamily/Rab-GTPase-TBC domain [Babesia duncani]
MSDTDTALEEAGYCGVSSMDIYDFFKKLGLDKNNSAKSANASSGGAQFAPGIDIVNTAKSILEQEFTLLNSRRIIWGYLLGAYCGESIQDLIREIKSSRSHYWKLVENHDKDKRISSIQTQNPQLFHPLAPLDRNPWAISEKLKELQEEIWQDIERTYQERPLFQNEQVKKSLQGILYVWSLEHDYISYKQGMNELLGLIYIACYRDQFMCDSENHQLADERFKYIYSGELKDIEADSFTLFNALMDIELQMMFDVGCINRVDASVSSMSQNLHRIAKKKIGATFNPLRERCHLIFHVILKEYDEALYTHLKELEIEPHLFLMRWIRLLFTREFNVNESLSLWDYIFADNFIQKHDNEEIPHFQMALIEYFAVAMLLFVRDDCRFLVMEMVIFAVLDGDVNYCLKRLFKYPPVNDISTLMARALCLKRPKFVECMDQMTNDSGSSWETPQTQAPNLTKVTTAPTTPMIPKDAVTSSNSILCQTRKEIVEVILNMEALYKSNANELG